MSEVVAEGILRNKELLQVKVCFKEDNIKIQLDELTTEINQQDCAANGKIYEVAKRLGEMEKNVAGKEKWDIGVKDTFAQLLNNPNLL